MGKPPKIDQRSEVAACYYPIAKGGAPDSPDKAACEGKINKAEKAYTQKNPGHICKTERTLFTNKAAPNIMLRLLCGLPPDPWGIEPVEPEALP
ncbi:MAG: hypothetical protein HYU97_00695 [Deltaproteobacteria bacterium]|nr:hypothetical protein [Deltaproteobacteria bacterium]